MTVSEETEVKGVDRELTTTGRTRREIFGWVTELFRIFVCMSCDSDLSIQFFTTTNIKKKNQPINQSVRF